MTLMNLKLQQFAEVMLGSDYPEFEAMLRDWDEPADVFIRFADTKKRLAMEDWTGECEDGETAGVIDEMLVKHWNRRLDWDADAYYHSVDASKFSRGDHPQLLFKALDEHLKTFSFRLVLFDIGGDCYYFGVLPKEEFDKVDGLSWEEYNVGSIDDQWEKNC